MTIREARASMGRLDEILQRRGDVLITRRGKPIARVSAVEDMRLEVPSHDDLRCLMPRMRLGSEKLLREERERT